MWRAYLLNLEPGMSNRSLLCKLHVVSGLPNAHSNLLEMLAHLHRCCAAVCVASTPILHGKWQVLGSAARFQTLGSKMTSSFEPMLDLRNYAVRL